MFLSCIVLPLTLTPSSAPTYKDVALVMAWNEPPGMYTKDPRHQELLRKVKKLIAVAHGKTINALDNNVDEFSRRYEEKDDPEKEG